MTSSSSPQKSPQLRARTSSRSELSNETTHKLIDDTLPSTSKSPPSRSEAATESPLATEPETKRQPEPEPVADDIPLPTSKSNKSNSDMPSWNDFLEQMKADEANNPSAVKGNVLLLFHFYEKFSLV